MKKLLFILLFATFSFLLTCGTTEDSNTTSGASKYNLAGYWEINAKVTVNEPFIPENQREINLNFVAKISQIGSKITGKFYIKFKDGSTPDEGDLSNIKVSSAGVIQFEVKEFPLKPEVFTILTKEEKITFTTKGTITQNSSKIDGTSVFILKDIKTTLAKSFSATANYEGKFSAAKGTPDPAKFPAGVIDESSSAQTQSGTETTTY